VELFDGQGFATAARIVQIGRNQVELIAEGNPIPSVEPFCRLTLAIAPPKGDRFDWLVEKATELGLARLIPLICERSVVDPRSSKLERLRRTVVESCKQCRRADLLRLEPSALWSDLVRTTVSSGELRLIALQSGLPPGRWPRIAAGCEVLLAVGPEGGFSPSEIDLARECGWHPVQLGPHVLRVETAGIAGISAVLAKTEEHDGDALD
jgi:16S rRNA (uracil1498-N3)-methyltransferase